MNATIERVFIDALSLPTRSRAELAHKLLASLEQEGDSPEIQAAWKTEALDRCKAYDAGKLTERDSARVLRGVYTGQKTKYLEITEAKYVSGYKIHLTFNYGKARTMDFEPFLRKAMNPDIAKYRQLRNFKKFQLHYGDLMWGDFEMVFPLTDLYKGEI